MNIAKLSTCNIAYKIYNKESTTRIVIETALASSCAEWWHLAEKWSKKYCVLIYDRAGYGLSSESVLERTPENIARELNELLETLNFKQVILIGHSIGGLYAYQFTKLLPTKVAYLILLDPLGPKSERFEKELTKSEFRKSGIDKSINLKIGYVLCLLGLGILLKYLLKKSPPFYYYDKFSKDAEEYILKNLTCKKMYKNAIKEYSYAINKNILNSLEIIPSSANIPLHLICHDPEIIKHEIEYFGNTNNVVSQKIDNIWLEIMKEYLKLSKLSRFTQAKDSGHFIHLTKPELIWEVIENLDSTVSNG